MNFAEQLNDDGAKSTGGAIVSEGTVFSLPKSCQEILDSDAQARSGEYTIQECVHHPNVAKFAIDRL